MYDPQCKWNRDIIQDSNFAIKCGGPQITSSNQNVYERDNETLGPATYYVTSTNRWAVSNVGRFINSNDPQYLSFSSQQFTNTLDSELFQTARNSPGSLRYYGLGLENGNYTVTLQFAEIVIPNPSTWQSLGRRVFDIYIQGNLVFEDFDIKKEAGGVSFQAVQKAFTAQVSENYLEIHLFWAGKGTCCIPAQGTYGPSISAISAVPDFIPTVSNKPPGSPTSKKSETSLIVGIVVPVGVVSFLSVLALCCFIKRRKRPRGDDDEGKKILRKTAWRLHENDSKVELVDANLLEFDEEEVKRVIGVALLCTQTSPQLRPSMSRAVAMLSGDIEVSAVTTRPGYLTDWKFDDTTNFMTIDTPNVENEYNQFSSSSATTAADPGHSPIIAVHEVEEVIGEGR
ncbi:hypothetical protein C3L33_09695, partial [Rhododendron williamsianum]